MSINVKDASGSVVAVELPNANGRAAAAASKPVAMATEDKAVLDAISAKLPASLGQTTMSASTPVAIASNQSSVPAKVLLAPGVARQLTTTNTSVDTTLTVGIKAISIYARNSDARFALATGAQTATSSSHFIAMGERLDFDVSAMAAPHIAIIYGPSAAAAILEISELN